jgi:hypothetical protein
MIAKAGVSTQVGYKHVLNQFLCSQDVKNKLEQWGSEKGDATVEEPVQRSSLSFISFLIRST